MFVENRDNLVKSFDSSLTSRKIIILIKKNLDLECIPLSIMCLGGYSTTCEVLRLSVLSRNQWILTGLFLRKTRVRLQDGGGGFKKHLCL